MAYEMVMPYHLHMPSYFLETFTEYPEILLHDSRIFATRFQETFPAIHEKAGKKKFYLSSNCRIISTRFVSSVTRKRSSLRSPTSHTIRSAEQTTY